MLCLLSAHLTDVVVGEVLKIELKDDDSFLIYGIEIVTSKKKIADIKIDAGNGKILLMEEDIRDESNDTDDRHDKDHEDED